jgi:hypothetical protein
MEGTSSTAVVEPKKKSQDPAAKAKRLKRLLTNPDFAEAVEFERSLVKKVRDELKITTDKYLVVMNERNEEKAKEVDGLQLRNDYIEQLLANKGLYKVIETMGRSITAQSETIQGLKGTVKAQNEILELDKKERNPNRVTGGKRGRPPGSKSKAVSFGAEAMPDHDLVPFGTRAEVAAALM